MNVALCAWCAYNYYLIFPSAEGKPLHPILSNMTTDPSTTAQASPVISTATGINPPKTTTAQTLQPPTSATTVDRHRTLPPYTIKPRVTTQEAEQRTNVPFWPHQQNTTAYPRTSGTSTAELVNYTGHIALGLQQEPPHSHSE